MVYRTPQKRTDPAAPQARQRGWPISATNVPVQITLSELIASTTAVYFLRLIIVGNGGDFPITHQLGQNSAGV
jgi:hypothetical protein